jgi:hypothetical protein
LDFNTFYADAPDFPGAFAFCGSRRARLAPPRPAWLGILGAAEVRARGASALWGLAAFGPAAQPGALALLGVAVVDLSVEAKGCLGYWRYDSPGTALGSGAAWLSTYSINSAGG